MAKQALIIYSGLKGSVEETALNTIIKGLKAKGKTAKVVDLHQEKFNPTYEGKDLALYSRGDTTDVKAKEYQVLVKETNEIYFVYSSKLNGMDAMMKGFFDKVFLSGDFWYARKAAYFTALWGTCNWIKKSTAVIVQEESSASSKASKKSVVKQVKMGILFALHMGGRKVILLTNSKDKARLAKFTAKVEARSSKKIRGDK